MIETKPQGQALEDVSGERRLEAVKILVDEMAAYRGRLPDLLAEHEGSFVLIKGSEIVGIFPSRNSARREGYRRFGVAPFLVRQVSRAEPVRYLPNVVP